MNTFYFQSCYHGVNIKAAVAGIDLASLFQNSDYNCFVPSLKLKEQTVSNLPWLVYTDGESIDLTFTADNSCSLQLPWKLARNGETIMYLAYALIEREHQRNRMLTAHAASVCRGDRDGALLLGKEGSGKSLTALKLCRDYGHQLGANDLAILCWNRSKVFVEGGTEFFYLREESVRRNLPELLPGLFTEATTKDSWLHKTKVLPESLGIDFYFRDNHHPHQVTRAYLVHVDETKTELAISVPSALTTTLYLNENFSRYIRNTCTTLLGGADYQMLGYIPAFDRPEFYQFRSELINYLMRVLDLRHVSGPLELVAEYIASN